MASPTSTHSLWTHDSSFSVLGAVGAVGAGLGSGGGEGLKPPLKASRGHGSAAPHHQRSQKPLWWWCWAVVRAGTYRLTQGWGCRLRLAILWYRLLEPGFSEVWGLEALQRAGRGLTYSKGLAGGVGILAPRHQGQQLGHVLFHKLLTLLPV